MKPYYERVEKEISKTMQLLDEMEPLPVHHLFMARLSQRIEEDVKQQCGKGILNARMDYRLGFILFLLMINVATTLFAIKNDGSSVNSTAAEIVNNQRDDYAGHEFAYYDQPLSNEYKTP